MKPTRKQKPTAKSGRILTALASPKLSPKTTVAGSAAQGVSGTAAPIKRGGWSIEFQKLAESPLFWAMLVLKLSLGAVLTSKFMSGLFVPFVNYFVVSGFKNPWAHSAALGIWNAFPYPPTMLVTLSFFRVLFSPLMDSSVQAVTALHLFAMRLPLFVADLSICVMLLRWFPFRSKRILLLYWASPITLYVCYWHGQLDIIPTALFLGSLFLIHEKKFDWAMVLFGVALASKSHLFFALPLLLIYQAHERGLKGAAQGVVLAGLAYALCLLPVIGDPAFRKMVFGSTEQMRLFALRIDFGGQGTSVLIAPLAVAVLLFRFAAYPKVNWDLFFAFIGILFGVFLLFIPPAPGYFLWSIPFVMYFLCRTPNKTHLALYGLYAFSYLFYQLHELNPFTQSAGTDALIANLSFTLMQASLAGMTLSMYLFGVRSNAVYDLRTNPVMIGLSGDSGSGKNRFVQLMSEVVGKERVTLTDGDDYHRWPRGHEMWKTLTHLDVRANDLYREHEHAISLARGGRVMRGVYDHDSGQFSENKPVDPNGVLFFAGLHSLSLKSMRNLYDLKIFLDPEEELRKQWKIERDCAQRGYTPKQVIDAMERRSGDAKKYVLPQKNLADVIVRFIGAGKEKLQLRVEALNSFNLTHLVHRLEQFAELKVEHDPFIDADWQQITVEGEITAEQVNFSARETIVNFSELTSRPEFRSGLDGCLQLIFLACLSEQLRWNNKQVAV